MRLKSAHFIGFKRFTDTRIDNLPESAKLVVLAGPNGSGKSSVFDGFRTWHGARAGGGFGWDESYGTKVGSDPLNWPERANLAFHGEDPVGEGLRRAVYIRTAFRNEADFVVNDFQRMASPLDSGRVSRLIDNDISVSDNFRRLVMLTIDGVYNDDLPEEMTRAQIRDRVIGQVREPLHRVFPDLTLHGVGGVGSQNGSQGTFYFSKGASDHFLYKNLSAGEKAVFDLLLDATIKREYFDDSIWCIDEPETHLNTRVQGLLLETLLDLLPDSCQLFIASHSLGFMRKASELASTRGSVAFLDMQGLDFDQPQLLTPVQPTREFWARTLEVALGDVATLVAPERVVLCEGRPGGSNGASFDAACYRSIFGGSHPETDFLSVGNSTDAAQDRIDFAGAMQTLRIGTNVTRLVDRDLRNDDEVTNLRALGIRVLSRRHIESYLYDEEVLSALCSSVGQTDKTGEVLEGKRAAIEECVSRGKDPDDIKAAAGGIFVAIRRILQLGNPGSDQRAFARSTLAPLLIPGMAAFDLLERDVFGSIGERPGTETD